MPWQYSQSTGRLTFNNTAVGTGYSGTGVGRNNPDAEGRANVGPVPRGRYTISAMFDTATHGPHVMRLTPSDGHDMHHRDGFLIHGDNSRHDASTGCIILPRNIRDRINHSNDHVLEVVR